MNLNDFDSALAKFTGQPWLKDRVILMAMAGSHAYGTNTASSDVDVRGVAIPPQACFFSSRFNWDQSITTDGTDLTVWNFSKFISLSSKGNPNINEILWTDSSDIIHVDHIGRRLIECRALFLSKQMRYTYSGYAKSQLDRISLHHTWLTKEISAPPTRTEAGLPFHPIIPLNQLAAAESVVQKKMDSWSLNLTGLDEATRIKVLHDIAAYLVELNISKDEWANCAARAVGYDNNFVQMLDAERQYNAKVNDWKAYQQWQRERNPQRAELEAKYGFDCKHAAHLVRLLRTCREVLTLGKVIVKRPDAEELLAIRNGAWSYEQLIEWANREDKAMGEVAKQSLLPDRPDYDKIDQLCIELIEESFG